ncbi:DUF1501 domain-containing protein [Pleomorphovibrio marinus]|uniref:DUF1501 domain-containing protein n=1 Tax=Pleomorphovibrio marinus TaxID=2164132 RepID=UPI000E0B6D7A|nr:DUF1501 domain-containing protein [Pleomorphovibrio marinus]
MCHHLNTPRFYWHKELRDIEKKMDRRHFLSKTAMGMGSLALGTLFMNDGLMAAPNPQEKLFASISNHAPKAKRIIYLFQSGGPSQLDLYEYKPKLRDMHGKDLPPSVRGEQRLTGMSANQSIFPIADSLFNFKQYGESRKWVSELMPHTAEVVDELCFINSMVTEQINHDPAITFMQSGHQLPGRPSIGAWMSYGLGTDNENLPSFVVMVSKNAVQDQPLYARLWGNGFLPSQHQGVQFRSGKDPVLFLGNPENYDGEDRKEMLEHLKALNEVQLDMHGDPEISARIAQYEMAFRMQTSVPEITDLSDEPDAIFEMYGEESRDPGTYAANCLMARRLIEKDVKFVQLYHQGWDQHGNLPGGIRNQCAKTDRATAALIRDLKQRGLLEDTLVVWGGEFGRTVYSQGTLTPDNYGRDHHPRCFTMWMAGAGVKAGYSHGETDELGYNVVKDPVHVHDFHATLLHLFGVDHEKLVFKHQGRRFRLTDVAGEIVKGILT